MKCLVIVICQTRGYKTTWNKFKENVIDSLDADLALCVSKSNSTDLFRENANYIWEYDDFDNWATGYDIVQKEIGSTINWRSVLDIDIKRESCLFGGIKHKNTIGSGALLFYYRWRVLENIRNFNLTSKYDWFIITRSDYYYPVKHVPLSMLSDDSVWIPNGEHYGGVTDRHIICPSKFIERSIDMLGYVLTEPTDFLINYKRFLGNKGANPETFISYYLSKQGIPVKFVPYFMYVVRELDETLNPTRYGNAGITRYNNTNYSIKYPNEKIQADKLHIKSDEDWVKYLS
jgi:hypothetical protein